jgi:predicted metal-dependent phosphoesterase TrpH
MKTPTIDLHTHTTASDGSLTPAELIRYAKEKDLSAVAVTDHDCVDGIEEALAEGRRQGIEVIPGLEISAEFGRGTMHVLGFFVDWKKESLRRRLSELQEARKQRNPKIVRNLQSLGLDITYEEVVAASGGGQVGRPHFAKVLMEKGYVRSIEEAFEKYLKRGAPGYEEKFRLSPEESIRLIHEAGGVAVLAHPFTLGIPSAQLENDLIPKLTRAGLDGIEAYYSKNAPEDTPYYLKLCETTGLLPSGGSDFHGAHKPGIDLAVGRGDLRVPVKLLETLREKARGYRQDR